MWTHGLALSSCDLCRWTSLHLATVPTRPTLLPHITCPPLCTLEFAIPSFPVAGWFPGTSLQDGPWGWHLWKSYKGQGSSRARREMSTATHVLQAPSCLSTRAAPHTALPPPLPLPMSSACLADSLQVDQMFAAFPPDVTGNLDYKNLVHIITHGEEKD